MTPEKLEELEKLEAAVTPGEWRHLMLRADVRDLFAALREAWRERDEARAALKPSGHNAESCCCPDCATLREAWRERDEALESLAIEIDLKKQSAEHIHSLYASSNKVFLEIVAARTKERDEARVELERLRPTDTLP